MKPVMLELCYHVPRSIKRLAKETGTPRSSSVIQRGQVTQIGREDPGLLRLPLALFLVCIQLLCNIKYLPSQALSCIPTFWPYNSCILESNPALEQDKQ